MQIWKLNLEVEGFGINLAKTKFLISREKEKICYFKNMVKFNKGETKVKQCSVWWEKLLEVDLHAGYWFTWGVIIANPIFMWLQFDLLIGRIYDDKYSRHNYVVFYSDKIFLGLNML